MEHRAGGLLYNVLIALAWNQYREDLTYVRLYAGIIDSGKDDEDYLKSRTFWQDCKFLGLTDELVTRIIHESRNQNIK